jgi:type IV secretory pathway TraG/TraD family ATPase VirD4
VTSSAVAALDYIAQQKKTNFSVRDWINEDKPGVLFIPYKAGQIAALRSTISGWMRLAIFETMDHGEDKSRLWFVVDELDALGQIDGLKDALARLRKFNGRCVLGFQSIAQVSTTYGQGDAHTIIENCGNTLILRCSASEGGGTARFASQLIGEREVLRTTTSRSLRMTEMLGSVSRSQHFSIESAVLPSEVEQLPDLTGYLKYASEPTWQRVRLDARNKWAELRSGQVRTAQAGKERSQRFVDASRE